MAVDISLRFLGAAGTVNLSMLSAHADRSELLRWLAGFRRPPERIVIVHDEPAVSDALRVAIGEELGWTAEVPGHLDEMALL